MGKKIVGCREVNIYSPDGSCQLRKQYRGEYFIVYHFGIAPRNFTSWKCLCHRFGFVGDLQIPTEVVSCGSNAGVNILEFTVNSDGSC